MRKNKPMRNRKGSAGYIRRQKTRMIEKTVQKSGIMIALLVLGITQTGDRMNLLTIVAVLGCLPASKALVGVIMLLAHRSIARDKATEIDEKASLLTRVYDLVFTSEKKIMPVECIVISGNTICGYASGKKVDTAEIAKHLKQYLHANQFTKVSVKIFDDYIAFITRAEGMNNIVSVEKTDTKKQEESIRNLLLNLSL